MTQQTSICVDCRTAPALWSMKAVHSFDDKGRPNGNNELVCLDCATKRLSPYATDDYFEYWLHRDEIYRNAIGNRGPLDTDITTMPMGTRWECSLPHFEHYYIKPGRVQVS